MSRIRKIRQHLPSEFADLLRQIRDEESPERLDSLLFSARLNGWTLVALAEALGWGREWVRQRIARARPAINLPPVPIPPRFENRQPAPRRRLVLAPELAAELRRMQDVAAQVRGTTPLGSPARQASRDLAAQLAAYVAQGVSVRHLAALLEVTPRAITARLERHGHRSPVPSSSAPAYGQRQHRFRAARPECGRGHLLEGDNLYTPPSGGRHCRACRSLRLGNGKRPSPP